MSVFKRNMKSGDPKGVEEHPHYGIPSNLANSLAAISQSHVFILDDFRWEVHGADGNI